MICDSFKKYCAALFSLFEKKKENYLFFLSNEAFSFCLVGFVSFLVLGFFNPGAFVFF